MTTLPLPTRADVLAAAARLRGQVRRTPTIRCEALGELAGTELWIKAENLQHIGAFKARGALNTVAKLSDEERRQGLITFSSGNHAQAVALAAKRYGVAATITMPVNAPAIKVDAVRALGAEVVQVGTTSLERRDAALEIQAERGGVIIQPFDHPHIIAGQGTATLELIEDVQVATGDDLDVLLIPVGGGGLLAGGCLAAEGTKTQIYGVEPEGCDSMGQSVRAGQVVAVEPGPSIADGLKPTRIGELNLAVARDRIAGSFTVTDEELGLALVRLLLRAKLLVEPSGAAALAVALRGELPNYPRRVGVILSGGNIAPDQLAELITTYAARI